MKIVFIGIDISKDTLDVAVCKELNQGISKAFVVENTIKGINKLIRQALKLNLPLWFCFEHTGNYGLLLAQLLQSNNLTYSMVPALEIKQSIGMQRGKNDKIDAERIALYATSNSHKLKATELPSDNLLKIKAILSYRSFLVKTSTQLQNRLKSCLITDQVVDINFIIKDIENQINETKEKIKSLEKAILHLIKSDERMKQSLRLAMSVSGVGLIIAVNIIVITNNFTSFNNPRKFNCYAGLAPFEHTSGSSIVSRTRTSHLRNKSMKTLLFNGANVAIRTDKELQAYYRRKTNEGKAHQVIINNVACKMIYRVFAVVARGQEYVKLVR